MPKEVHTELPRMGRLKEEIPEGNGGRMRSFPGENRRPLVRVWKKGLWKRGLFRKVHFPEILENLEILDSLESPQSPGKQRRIRPFSRDSSDFRDFRDPSSEKTPFVMAPLSAPDWLTTSPMEAGTQTG